MFFVPKNTFALDFNSSADYCTYHNGSTVTCGKTNLVKFPNAGNNTGWSAVNTKVSNFDVNSNSFVRLEHTNAQYLCNDKNYGGNVIFYIWFNRPYAKHFVTSNFDYGGNSSFFTCTSWELANGYGLAYSCDFNGSINGSSLGLNLRYVNAGGDVDVSNSLTVGWGTYIGDDVYTCNVDIAGSINTSINSSTNTIINNQNNNQQQTNTRLDGINDTMKDDSAPDTKGFLDSIKVDESNSPVSDLITMPLTLMNAYVNGFSSSCQPVNFGNLYGSDIIFPCIDIKKYLGNTLYSLIDMLFCIFMAYNIGMMCISIYESITSLDDAMQLLYTPQHAGHSRVNRGESEGLY